MISAATWVKARAPREAGAAFLAWLARWYPRQAPQQLDDAEWAKLYQAFLAEPVR